MDINMISIGNRIRDRRKELRLTQTDVFHECGIASGALSQMENGTRTPSAITLYKLSQVLKCNMEWLITGKSTHSENHEISKKEEKILYDFRKLSNEDQEELQEILQLKLRKMQRQSKENAKSSLSNFTRSDNMVG